MAEHSDHGPSSHKYSGMPPLEEPPTPPPPGPPDEEELDVDTQEFPEREYPELQVMAHVVSLTEPFETDAGSQGMERAAPV